MALYNLSDDERQAAINNLYAPFATLAEVADQPNKTRISLRASVSAVSNFFQIFPFAANLNCEFHKIVYAVSYEMTNTWLEKVLNHQIENGYIPSV